MEEGGDGVTSAHITDPAALHEIVWLYDPAAFGPRERAILSNGWVFVAYHNGDWGVYESWTNSTKPQAVGHEATLELAQMRCIKVYEAMTR